MVRHVGGLVSAELLALDGMNIPSGAGHAPDGRETGHFPVNSRTRSLAR
jgi:hypothetical protein